MKGLLTIPLLACVLSFNVNPLKKIEIMYGSLRDVELKNEETQIGYALNEHIIMMHKPGYFENATDKENNKYCAYMIDIENGIKVFISPTRLDPPYLEPSEFGKDVEEEVKEDGGLLLLSARCLRLPKIDM